MTFDPAAAVLGADLDADLGADRDADVGGDAEHLRAVARRQWTARRDLERRLHDGAALRLSALALQLGLLHHRHPAGGGEPGGQLAAAVEELQDGLHLVLQELRDVAGLLYPPLLDEAGLGPALREAAGRCPVPVRVHAPRERFGAAVEGVAYFALLGCLPVAEAKDAGAPRRAPATEGRTATGSRPPAAPPAVGPDPVIDPAIDPVIDPVIDIVIRREGDVLVLLVHGVAGCHAGPIDDGVRLLGGTVTVGDPDREGLPGDRPRGAVAVGPGRVDRGPDGPITVRIPCA
jgi:hypothetical protein